MEFVRSELSNLFDKAFREMFLTELPTLTDVKEEKIIQKKEVKQWPDVTNSETQKLSEAIHWAAYPFEALKVAESFFFGSEKDDMTSAGVLPAIQYVCNQVQERLKYVKLED